MASLPSHEPAAVRTGWGWIAVFAAITAAAIVAAVNLREQLRWEQNRHFEDAKQIANLSAALESANARDRALAGARATGEATILPLVSSAGGAAGHLVWNGKERTVTLLASGLEPLGAGAAYELWLTPEDGAAPRSVARLEPEPDGLVRHSVRLPDLQRVEHVAVTVEPAGDDAPGPSGRVVLANRVPRAAGAK